MPHDPIIDAINTAIDRYHDTQDAPRSANFHDGSRHTPFGDNEYPEDLAHTLYQQYLSQMGAEAASALIDQLRDHANLLQHIADEVEKTETTRKQNDELRQAAQAGTLIPLADEKHAGIIAYATSDAHAQWLLGALQADQLQVTVLASSPEEAQQLATEALRRERAHEAENGPRFWLPMPNEQTLRDLRRSAEAGTLVPVADENAGIVAYATSRAHAGHLAQVLRAAD